MEPRESSLVIYPKIGHMKKYFSPLLHLAHNSDRRTTLFSRTSFYRIKVTSLPRRHALSSLSKMKICCSKNKGAFSTCLHLLLFLASWCVLIRCLFFVFVCIIIELEILVQGHLLSKKSLLRSWIDVVPQLRQSVIERIRKWKNYLWNYTKKKGIV